MEGRWKGRAHYMELDISDAIVYPYHGAAKVENIIEQKLDGEAVQYLILQIPQSDLDTQVPAKNAELAGVRNVVGEGGLLKVFSVLHETGVEGAGNWSRRCRANQERLGSDDINRIAEIVRDLWRRDQDHGLSAGEKRILSKACQVLVGEFALADSIDEAKAKEVSVRVDATVGRHHALAQEGAASERKDKADDKPVDLDADA